MDGSGYDQWLGWDGWIWVCVGHGGLVGMISGWDGMDGFGANGMSWERILRAWDGWIWGGRVE